MAKRLDTEVGARFRAWLKSCYGSIGAAAEAYNMKPESLNPYFKGDLELGGVWISRIEENGGDYHYILTGRRPDSRAASVYGGNKRYLGSINCADCTPDEILIELHEGEGSTEVRAFQKLAPAVIPIAAEPEITYLAAAKAGQTPSGRAFEEEQEP